MQQFDRTSADSIDYNNEDEICGFQILLCKRFEYAGGFMLPHKTNAAIREVQMQGQIWLRNVRQTIDRLLNRSSNTRLTLASIPRILSAYDLVYRICNGVPCFDYLKDVKLKTVDRWVKGDKSIPLTEVALLLRSEIDRDIRSIEHRYLDFSGRVISSWIEDLRLYDRLRDLSLSESYHVLDFLLQEDLSVYGVRDSDKQKWIDTYTLTDGEIDQLDLKVLWAYIGFDRMVGLRTIKTVEERHERYDRLIKKVANHPDSDIYTREAISMYLAKQQTA